MISKSALAPLFAASLIPFLMTASGCTESAAISPTAVEAAPARGESLEVEIYVSPATLVLDSPGTWVTVHAEIPLSEVEAGTVMLNGLIPTVVKADSCGDLVAKFDRADVVSIVAPPEAALTLTGQTAAGTAFSGTDTVVVQ